MTFCCHFILSDGMDGCETICGQLRGCSALHVIQCHYYSDQSAFLMLAVIASFCFGTIFAMLHFGTYTSATRYVGIQCWDQNLCLDILHDIEGVNVMLPSFSAL